MHIVVIDESQLTRLMDLFQIGALDIKVFPSMLNKYKKVLQDFIVPDFPFSIQNKLDKEIVKCSDN